MSINNNITASGTIYIRYNNILACMEWSQDLTNYTQTNSTQNIILSPNSGSLIIKIISDIQINNKEYYFVLNTDNITIDGQNYTFYINILGYRGLIKYDLSSTPSNNGSNLIIQNIHVDGTTSSLYTDNTEFSGGWIGQNQFLYGTFNNCSSKGPIVYRGGGIVGSYVANNINNVSGNVTLNNCYSSGDIDEGAGGICGYHSGDSGGTVTVNNCYSSGKIGYGTGSGSGTLGNQRNAGGIFGSYCLAYSNGNIYANNCYSTGEICGSYAGGIFGANTNVNNGPDNDLITVQNCFSTGNISGQNAGGIFGGINYSTSGGSNNAISCYTTGIIFNDILTSAGGIFGGVNLGLTTPTYKATNCKFNGSITQIAGVNVISVSTVNTLALGGKL